MTDRNAIIYYRVSNKKQKHDGDGLHSQEHRCRDYAAARGYVVEAVFHDDVSGGGDFMKRPGMVAMLRFLKKRRREDCIVIFDDLKRFARDTVFHLKLRQELATYNATVECLNFKFEDSPEGQFVETVIAAQGQLERLQNRRQTLQKMKARVERGYYVFAVPVGYRYEKAGSHGRLLIWNDLSSRGEFDGFMSASWSSASGQQPGQRSSTVDHSDIRGSSADTRHHGRDSSGAASD